jgi:hypothetical protein
VVLAKPSTQRLEVLPVQGRQVLLAVLLTQQAAQRLELELHLALVKLSYRL